MSGTARQGLTIPLSGVPLETLSATVTEMAGLGYTDFWSAESSGHDGAVPLAVAACAAPEANLGTAILPVFTRGPALLAMTAASLASLAPGRFSLGLGSSSPAIVTAWNDIPLTTPYQRTRDVLRFVRRALTGEKVDFTSPTVNVRGFRLDTPPAEPPPILLAALRPRMLKLAATEADGAILNWIAPADLGRIRDVVGDETTVVARFFVCASTDEQVVRRYARRVIAAYLTVPGYAAQQQWLGRGPALEGLWSAWAAGDRRAAVESLTDELVDELIVHGTPEQCRDRIGQYVRAGVDVPVVFAMDCAVPVTETARALAPARTG